MRKKNEIKIFEDKKVRTLWDEENEKWFFSVHEGDYFRLLTPGEYEVTVYAEGYEPQSKLVEVSKNEHNEAPGTFKKARSFWRPRMVKNYSK